MVGEIERKFKMCWARCMLKMMQFEMVMSDQSQIFGTFSF